MSTLNYVIIFAIFKYIIFVVTSVVVVPFSFIVNTRIDKFIVAISTPVLNLPLDILLCNLSIWMSFFQSMLSLL